MNKGDKIICANSYEVGGFSYKEGDIWQIVDANAGIYCPIKAIPTSFKGDSKGTLSHRFSLLEMKNWITLAEWRDLQIDKILEDD